jgi:mono/diheme cytochrome c family protein
LQWPWPAGWSPSRRGPRKPSRRTAAEKVTYEDHLKPILREHCFVCHNQNEKKGGLAVDTYASLMEGGSSGEVVYESDPDSSRLWTLVNHDETPYMPPNQDRIADAKLAI